MIPEAGTPVVIAFGANLAPEANLAAGLARLRQQTGILALSTIYRTLAVTADGHPLPPDRQPEYLNGVLTIPGQWEPRPLHDLLRRIEQEQGRTRGPDRFAPRPLDLDIVLMGERVVQDGDLTIPDPDLLCRPFLALAAAELAPRLPHPVTGITLSALAEGFGPCPPGIHAETELTRHWRTLFT